MNSLLIIFYFLLSTTLLSYGQVTKVQYEFTTAKQCSKMQVVNEMPSTCTRNPKLNRYEKYVCLNGNVQITYDCRESNCTDIFCTTETVSNNFCNTVSAPYKYTCDAVEFTPKLIYEDCYYKNGTEFKSSLGCIYNREFQCENNKLTVKSWNFAIGCPNNIAPDNTKTISMGECGHIVGTEWIKPKSCSLSSQSQGCKTSLFGIKVGLDIPFRIMFAVGAVIYFGISIII